MYSITYVSRHTYSPAHDTIAAASLLDAVHRFRERRGDAVPIVAMSRVR